MDRNEGRSGRFRTFRRRRKTRPHELRNSWLDKQMGYVVHLPQHNTPNFIASCTFLLYISKGIFYHFIQYGHCVCKLQCTYCKYIKGRGKAVPLQAWSGPEGYRKLRFPDYMTTAQDGGKVVSPTHRPPLPPRNAPGTHFC